jgi:dTDP-3-amino-3,4,6-trideoxy-alpha-D-glucose transaminase
MIALNDFRRQWQETRADTMSAVDCVGESGWYVLGKQVEQFESELATYWGLEAAVGVGSGLDAVEIGLRVVGCRAGDRVLTTPVSAFATTLAILRIGAVPVFVDCDPFGLIDLDMCRSALEADRGIRFFVPVHLYGHCLDLRTLQDLREQFGLAIVEDCAQSIGTRRDGVPNGTVGQVAATSFYPTKNLGALGDGGALLTNDQALRQSAKCLRDYGQNAKYQHDETGYNSRLDELHAAILRRSHLPRLDSWTKKRRDIASRYCEGITNGRIAVPGAPPGSESCWHIFPVFVDPSLKRKFISHMRAAGVITGEHYPVAIIDQKALRESEHHCIGRCPAARRTCASEVSLPIHPYLTDEEVQQVVEACNGWRGN